MSSRCTFVGRSVGALALLPTEDRDRPYVVLGSTSGGLELCVEEDSGGGAGGDSAELAVASYATHPGAVTALAADPCGAFVAATSASGGLSLFALRSARGVLQLGIEGDDGRWGPSFAGTWNEGAGTWVSNLFASFSALTSPGVGVAVSGDGSAVGVLREDGLLTVHHASQPDSGAVVAGRVDGGFGAASGLAWRGAGAGACVTGGGDGVAKLWDLAGAPVGQALGAPTGSLLPRPALSLGLGRGAPPGAPVSAVACSASDSSKVAVSHADGAVLVWDLRFAKDGGQPLASLSLSLSAPHATAGRRRHPEAAGLSSALAFHPRDATALLSGGSDGCVRLLDLASAATTVSVLASASALVGGLGPGGTAPKPRCVGLAFDAAASYLAAGFDNDAVGLCSRHPRLAAGSRRA